MPAEVTLVIDGSSPAAEFARWEFVCAVRDTSPRAYGLIRHYPWSAGCSPLTLLKPVSVSQEETRVWAAHWDHHGGQEELYACLFVLHALTKAVPAACARLLWRCAPHTDIPTPLVNMEPLVEDVLLLEMSAAVEESDWFDSLLADSGTNDFSYEKALSGRVWLFGGGRIGLVPVEASREEPSSQTAEFLSITWSENGTAEISASALQWRQLHRAACSTHERPWERVLNKWLSEWLVSTAVQAGIHARHTTVVAVPPVVALTLHRLTEHERHELVFHHCLDYPVASPSSQSSWASRGSPHADRQPLVVPVRGRSSRWYKQLGAGGGAAAEKRLAQAESELVATVSAAFTVQTQNDRLARVPLRGLSRHAFALLLCTAVPAGVATDLARATAAAVAAPSSSRPHTADALHVGFQLTWALARWQKWLSFLSRHGNPCDGRAVEQARRLNSAAVVARERATQLGLSPEAQVNKEEGGEAGIATLERELFFPDDSLGFRCSSDAWVAESLEAVHREFLQSTPRAGEDAVDVPFHAVGQALSGLPGPSHSGPSDGTNSGSNSDSDDDSDDTGSCVADVLREMESLEVAMYHSSPTPRREGSGAPAKAPASEDLLQNKPLMDVIELLSRRTHAPS